MTQEEKQLLMKDLCARLPYGVKAQVLGWDEEKGEVEIPLRIYSINTDGYVYFETNDYDVDYLAVDACRLYLRIMSSMTEEEKHYINNRWGADNYGDIITYSSYESGMSTVELADIIGFQDWLNKNMFDYRNLIPKGLAVEAPDEMYGKEEL